MSRDYLLGLATIPALLIAAGLVWLARYALPALARRWTPPYWTLRGPQRHALNAADVYRHINVQGGHAATHRRLARLGPWGLYVVRYRPGHVEDHAYREVIP
jgi:hypothetical protein